MNAGSNVSLDRVFRVIKDAVTDFKKWTGKDKKITPGGYLDKLEGQLKLTELDRAHWYKALSMVIPASDETAQKWITDNIVTPKLSWYEAREEFIKYFRLPDENITLEQSLNECQQTAKEFST